MFSAVPQPKKWSVPSNKSKLGVFISVKGGENYSTFNKVVALLQNCGSAVTCEKRKDYTTIYEQKGAEMQLTAENKQENYETQCLILNEIQQQLQQQEDDVLINNFFNSSRSISHRQQ